MSVFRIGVFALALAASAGLAHAQTTTPSQNPAPAPQATTPSSPSAGQDRTANTRSSETEKPPLAGANSFTEEQAKERIARAGFENVQALKKDDKGIWRGQAVKGGQQVGVALDYRGNVVQQ
jgi:hypothetical protein